MQQHRALILRSNRFLGSTLVNKGLISSGDLELANEKFMEAIQTPELLNNASILTTLLYDMKALDETRLLEHTVDENSVGLIDLNHIELRTFPSLQLDLSLCRASSTMPFDQVEQTFLVATCYFLSAPVIKQWEEILGGEILWYATSIISMSRALERLEDLIAAEKATAAEAVAEK